MSDKIMKKILSVLMAIILIVTCVAPSFAISKGCTCGNNPMLIISGFSEFDLVNYDTGKNAWIPETDSIVSAVEQAMPSLTKLLASDKTQADYDTFCDDFLPIVNGVLDDISVAPDGEPAHSNVGLVNQFTESVAYYGIDTVMAGPVFDKDIVKSACNAVGADHVFVYGLDWRMDPLVLADEINDYIQHIKEVTNHRRVSISGISMGGVVLSAYIAKYGTDDLSNITMISSAFTGVEMVGKLFTGEVAIDEAGLYQIITEAIGNSTLSTVLEKTGILKKLIPIVEDLFACESDRIYAECLIPNFGYNTGIWAFVPESYFKQAKTYMRARMNNGTPEQAEIFWARVNEYHNTVKTQIASLLQEAKDKGVCVAVVSNYNSQMSPVTTASDLSGDQVIETIHTSGYATVAKLGSTLGESYKRNAYLSEDRIIDASTCYLPDNTWFIKNQKHVQFSETNSFDNGAFYAWILTAKTQYDINTNSKYPQFMVYDSDAKLLSTLSNVPGDTNGDNVMNIIDVRNVLSNISGAVEFTSSQQWAADLDYDGRVSIIDARMQLTQIANS